MTVIVVGGGGAGLMAAGTAAEQGAKVILLERNEKVGRKLYITGKGRCNVCNDCEVQNVLAHIPQNPRFLYAALSSFPPASVMDFFERQGVSLKTERGGRVFPVSDKSADVIDALYHWNLRQGVRIVQARATALQIKDGAVCGVQAEGQHFAGDRVILATGGASYPKTGSTGDGYLLAKQAGHSITPCLPSLVGLCEKGDICSRMMGLSLRNVRLSVFENEKKIHEDFGELLFSHYGMTGPLVLSASAHIRQMASKSYRVEINLKPALDEKTLEKRLLSDFEARKNHDFANSLDALLPRKMIPVVVELSGIEPHKKVHSITKQERRRLLQLLSRFPIEIAGKRPLSEAVVTSGGVNVRELDPKTMQSKKCAGLYFAGELIDVDAYTGGYNLQIAWSTGRLAGLSAVL